MADRILLLQLDGKIPNLALMRIAAHHRTRGDALELRIGPSVERQIWDDHDRVYASLVFGRTRPVAERLLEVHPSAVIGGSGWDLDVTLEGVGITTLEQDYGIYPGFAPSIGFTQRGCRFRCPFCIVPRAEGANRTEQSIADLWRGEPHPRKLVLLDNDFFGQPQWRERIAEIRDGGFSVSFNQGINACTLDAETAAAIASVDYRDDQMRRPRLYTSWDSRKDERRLLRGLEQLVDAGVAPGRIMVYMLIGYWPNESHEDRDYRRHRLREFGAIPYPMPYVRTPELLGFQRWVIGAYDKSIPWDEWRAARYQPRHLKRKVDQLSLLPA